MSIDLIYIVLFLEVLSFLGPFTPLKKQKTHDAARHMFNANFLRLTCLAPDVASSAG